MQTPSLIERSGLLLGAALAPLTAAGSAVRRARLFHPCGITLVGRAQPISEQGDDGPLAARLAGPVLVRFSGGFWKHRQWLDVLGCAIRFTDRDPPQAQAQPGDQDLLLATIKHPLTTMLAPLSTDVGDYLANDYFGVSPFQNEGLDRVKLRLSPVLPAPVLGSKGGRRDERLRAALRQGKPALRLQVRALGRRSQYRTLLTIELHDELPLDARALHFDPFRCARGLRPVGFVHQLRVASYAASRWARPHDG